MIILLKREYVNYMYRYLPLTGYRADLTKLILIHNNLEVQYEYFYITEPANILLKTNNMKAIKEMATEFKTEIIIFSSYMIILNVLLIISKIGL